MTYLTGTISNSPQAVVIANAELPSSIHLSSVAPNRKIEFSVDNGVNWFVPQYDSAGTTAAQLVVTVMAPVSDVRFTGAIGDSWGVR